MYLCINWTKGFILEIENISFYVHTRTTRLKHFTNEMETFRSFMNYMVPNYTSKALTIIHILNAINFYWIFLFKEKKYLKLRKWILISFLTEVTNSISV